MAARDCFAELGFGRATNRDIASAAGLTSAAIYRYYDSKPDLYIAVVRFAMSDLVPHLRALVAREAGARAAMRALVRALGSLDEGQRAAARFLSAIASEMQRHPQVARRMLAEPGDAYVLMNEIVDAGVHAREIAVDKAPRAVALLISLFMGITAYATTLGQTYSELAIAGFVDLLDGTLFDGLAGE